MDDFQDWEIEQIESYTQCPDLDKCTFACAAKRPFETQDPSQDYQFMNGGGVDILAVYTVYVGAEMLVQGWQHWEGFVIPLSAVHASVGGLVAMGVAGLALY